MIVFRQADPRYPFLWSGSSQPAARWHGDGEGPAHYFADTPDGAWAELLRHEEIVDPADVVTVRRTLWAIDIGDDPMTAVSVKASTLVGGPDTYPACQSHARLLRKRGVRRIVAPSAALVQGSAGGWTAANGQQRRAAPRDGRVIVVFGEPDGLVAWKAVDSGAPPGDVLSAVHHYLDR
jgi:hypothetical protein